MARIWQLEQKEGDVPEIRRQGEEDEEEKEGNSRLRQGAAQPQRKQTNERKEAAGMPDETRVRAVGSGRRSSAIIERMERMERDNLAGTQVGSMDRWS